MWRKGQQYTLLCCVLVLIGCTIEMVVTRETGEEESSSTSSTSSRSIVGWSKSKSTNTATVSVTDVPLTFVTALTPEPDETLTTSSITSSITSSMREDLEQKQKQEQGQEVTARQESTISSYRHEYPSGKLHLTFHGNVNETLQSPEIVYPITVRNNGQKLSRTAVTADKHSEIDEYMDFESDDVDVDEEEEEKKKEEIMKKNRQSTIQEVLSNLFPHGFTNIFQYSGTMANQMTEEEEEEPTITVTSLKNVEGKMRANEGLPTTTTTTTNGSNEEEITPINGHGINAVSINNLMHTQEIPLNKPSEYVKLTESKIDHQPESKNQSDAVRIEKVIEKDIRIGTTVTREYRRETSPGHMEIVIEKLVHDDSPATAEARAALTLSNEQTNKSHHLRTVEDDPRTTRSETIALPTLLYNNKTPSPSTNFSPSAFIAKKIDDESVIVFPDADFLEDFEDIDDEDDNQLAESKSVGTREVYHKPPESTHYQNTAHHDINIHIIHDDSHSTSRRPAIFDTTTKKKFYFTPAPRLVTTELDDKEEEEEDEEEEAERLPRPPSKGRARIRTHQFFGTTRSPLAKTVTHKIPQKKNEVVAPKKTITFYSPTSPTTTTSIHRTSSSTMKVTTPPLTTTTTTKISEEPIRLLNSTISKSYSRAPTITADITIAGPMKNTEMLKAITTTRPTNFYNRMKNNNGDFNGKTVYRIVHPENGNGQSVTPINVILVPIDTVEDMTPEPLYPTQLPPLMISHLPIMTTTTTTTTHDKENEDHDDDDHHHHHHETESSSISEKMKSKPKVLGINSIASRNKTRKDYRKKQSTSAGAAPFTFVEVQKSINIHNKLIKEQGGRLLEEHDVFFNRQPSKQNYNDKDNGDNDDNDDDDDDNQPKPSETSETTSPESIKPSPSPASHISLEPYGDESVLRVQTYGELTKNPINVSGNEDEGQEGSNNDDDDGEVSASFRDEQLAYAPNNNNNNNEGRVNVESIHYSQPIQEIHTIEEVPNTGVDYPGPKYEDIKEFAQNANSLNMDINYQLPTITTNYGISSSAPSGSGIVESLPLVQQSAQQQPFLLHGIIEKHIPIPYSVPAPVPVPVAIEHYIDRPYPIETIVEKPVPYPVEKIVEKVVEKRVPVEVERIVEKPIEKVVRKYINRPVGIPIKVPVALQFTAANIPGKYIRHSGPSSSTSPAAINVSPPWSSSLSSPVIGNNLTPLPFSVVRTYYNKMLKKLIPPTSSLSQQQQQPMYIKSRPTAVKPYLYKTGKELKYELKPPPPSRLLPVNSIGSSGSSSGPILTSSVPPAANLPKPPTTNSYDASAWDKGARYQYDFSGRAHDLLAAQSIRDNQQQQQQQLLQQQQKGNNFDEFLRWRNGHLLKRSPELGRDLQVEYGFKPPLVPSIEIDDHGIPLKKNSAQRR